MLGRNESYNETHAKDGNELAKEFGLAGLILVLGLLVFPLFVAAIPFYILFRSLKRRNIHLILSVIGLVVFVFMLIYNSKSYFGFLNVLPFEMSFVEKVIGENISFSIESMVTYVSGGLFVSYMWSLITDYYRAKKVSSKEDQREVVKNSALFKKVYDNRFKLNLKAQEKWRKALKDNKTDQLLLGVNQVGKPYLMDFKEVNQHMFVPATTGGGKTILLLNYIEYALAKEYPLIFIDGKGSLQTIDEVQGLCDLYRKELKVFSDTNNITYNPLEYGGATVIKDKLEQLVETESKYYTELSTSLIQVLIQFIDDYDFKRDLWTFATYLNPEKIKDVLNADLVEEKTENGATQKPKIKDFLDEETEDEPVPEKKKVMVRSERANKYNERFFKRYEHESDGELYLFKNASTVRTQIYLLLDSELGHLFEEKEDGVDLIEMSNQKEALFVSFDGLIYDNYIKIIARFLILDLNYLVSYRNRNKMEDQPLLAVYDEFSVYANDKIIDTINKSRSGGFHCIIATQTIADLEKLDPVFARQIIGNTNTYAIGQTNHPDEVESWANTLGTYKDIDITTVTERQEGRMKRIEMKGDQGTVRYVQKFKIPPDEIKQMKMGQFIISRKASKEDVEPEIVYIRHPLKT